MKKSFSILVTLFLLAGCGGKSEKRIMVGLVNFISGTAFIISADGKETPARIGLPVDSGMKIRTKGAGSICEIYINENVIKIFGNTEISIDKLKRNKQTDVEETSLSLISGRGFFKVKNRLMKNQDFHVNTKNCTAAVRGTEFFVTKMDRATSVACLEGKVEVRSEKHKSSVEIEENERAIASDKSKPVKSDIESRYIDEIEKDAEVKPATDENNRTFDKIGTGDKSTLSVIRKKLKELRTPKEVKEKEKAKDENYDDSDKINLFNFKMK